MTASAPVKLVLPSLEGMPVATEHVWATPLGRGRYRIENITAYTAAGFEDVVAADAVNDTLVARQIVVRSGRCALTLVAADPVWGRRLGDVHQALAGSPVAGGLLTESMQLAPGGTGILAASCPSESLERALRVVQATARSALGLTPQAITQRLQDLYADHDQLPGERDEPLLVDVRAHGTEPVPQQLVWDPDVLEQVTTPAPVIELTLDEHDPVLSTWPTELCAMVLDLGRRHEGMAGLLEARLLRPALHLALRLVAPRDAPWGPVGWPLGVPHDEQALTAARLDWQTWTRGGQTRYAQDDELNELARAAMRACGLDPDADPYQPVGLQREL